MESRIGELRWKEVICLRDGSRLGYVEDLEVELAQGQVLALIIPGRRRLFGLLGRREGVRVPWSAVRQFGADIILVDEYRCE